MTRYIVGYGWQEMCNGIRCAECQFLDEDGNCKIDLYIKSQPVYEEEKVKETDNALGNTLRKYLHSLSDTDLSLEEIKVALLLGICKQLDLLKKGNYDADECCASCRYLFRKEGKWKCRLNNLERDIVDPTRRRCLGYEDVRKESDVK